MTPIDYIRIDTDILKLNLSDKSKMLLGLIKRFDNNGLMMSNPELGKLLNTSPKHITRLLSELQDYVQIENPQSKYRKIFYFRKNAEVESNLLPQKCGSKENLLPHTGELLPQKCGHTSALARNITKGNKKEAVAPSLAFAEYWNSKPNLPHIRVMTDERKKELAVRMKERDFAEHWREIIDRISASSFCTGSGKKGWKASVDWLLRNSTNYNKVLEAKYDDDVISKPTAPLEIGSDGLTPRQHVLKKIGVS